MTREEILNKEKGFTLIELAIVLVIIGLILGAVLKGQDLIQNARMKKFIVDAGKKFEVAAWTVYDRTGKFPGDADGNGIIGDNATANPDAKTDITNANLSNPPTNPVSFGSYTFYVFYGNDAGTSKKKNVIIICGDSTCSSAVDAGALEYFKAFDTAIDGSANGTKGNVVGLNAVGTPAPNTSTWIATGSTTYSAWGTNTKALEYYFDAHP